MAGLAEIRSTFLNYFKKHGHEEVKSSTLVPSNDPTLMFTNSGMVQFKNVFTGLESRSYDKAVTSQKCLRAGGKHNDLDNVGYTSRHHTFFEMLGNFSFGNYFKEKAIPLAWDLITKEFSLPKERLLVTVFHTDNEAIKIWKKYAGLSDSQIIKISTSDNFWSMGSTGPCGPCSEIFFDHGSKVKGGPPGSANEDGDRFVEIWNLVFMQYDQLDSDKRENLPRPSIDTGMGLERMGAVLQGTHDNYNTDLMRALIEESANLSNQFVDGKFNIHHRVIADHIRSISFLIAEGIFPSNEGRGYILRRIMRRAMRHIHFLGVNEPMLHKMVASLTREMGAAFPELIEAKDLIEESLLNEEIKFRSTLDRGLKLLDKEINRLNKGEKFSGEVAFKLYDTYGFPIDLTQDVIREIELEVDIDSFNVSMEKQKEKARNAWVGSGEKKIEQIWFNLANNLDSTEFLGYNTLNSEAKVLAIVANGKTVDTIEEGNLVELISRIPNLGKNTEVIISCGKSKDNTFDVAKSLKSKHLDIKVIEQSLDGKSNAVWEALEASSGEIIAILDADLSVDPEKLVEFFEIISLNRADFVNGTRLIYNMEKGSMRLINNVGNRIFQFIVTLIIRLPLTDSLCGTKVFKKNLYEKIKFWQSTIKIKDPFGDFDLLFAAAFSGQKILELPIHYKSRTYGKTQIKRYRDGFILIRYLLKSFYKFNSSL